ncbi:MAG TPA: hypothetical protein VN442_22520 [Bryobacteraceae bacterium]|nr:hypothetical protein [Bryobacteraceae bacterium]
MRTLAAVSFALILAGSLSAQHRGNRSGFGSVVFPGGTPRPGVSGFGNVIWPGGSPSTLRTLPPFSITNPGFAAGLGGTVSGHGPFSFSRQRGGFNRRQPYIYVPYAYPVYAGGMDAYGYQEQQQPQVTVVYPPPQPPVVLNQTFGATATPVMQEFPPEGNDVTDIKVYQAPARSDQEMAGAVPTGQYYLIAFKDNSIYSAVAYWIDGDTLHYFTSGNNHNQVSMSLVDRELTERLNRERKVDVKLPK